MAPRHGFTAFALWSHKILRWFVPHAMVVALVANLFLAHGGRFYALHVPTLDDVDREELVSAPLNFVDNAHDRPDRAPIDTRLM